MATGKTGNYPRELQAEIALRDGSTVHVRPVRADDTGEFRAFLNDVSPESIGFVATRFVADPKAAGRRTPGRGQRVADTWRRTRAAASGPRTWSHA